MYEEELFSNLLFTLVFPGVWNYIPLFSKDLFLQLQCLNN